MIHNYSALINFLNIIYNFMSSMLFHLLNTLQAIPRLNTQQRNRYMNIIAVTENLVCIV